MTGEGEAVGCGVVYHKGGRDMDKIVVGVVAAGVGFLLGLAVTMFSARPPTDEQPTAGDPVSESATPEQHSAALIGENRESESQAGGDDKNMDERDFFAALGREIGPGTPCHRFATNLRDCGAWDPQGEWAIHSPWLTMHFGMLVYGEGKLFMMGVARPGGADEVDVTMVFKVSDVSDLDKALDNRNRRFGQVGRAFGLDDAELRRLAAIGDLLPLAYDNHVETAMTAFLRDMPPRVRKDFVECLLYLGNKKAAKAAKVMILDDCPAIGFPLSDHCMAEVVFGAEETSRGFPSMEYHEGPWWSLIFFRSGRYLSGDPEKPDRDGVTEVHWPRLTLDEVDELNRERQ